MFKKILWGLGALFLLPIIVISQLLIFWGIRNPPIYDYDKALQLEHWTAIPPGDSLATQHNAFTDIVIFNDSFFMAYRNAKWHPEDKNSALVIAKSDDARNWEEVARITLPGTDVRDPKLAVINGRLFMYFLPNHKFRASPHTTYWTVSDDGLQWSEPQETVRPGWVLWRPKTRDGENWYVMASVRKPDYPHKISVLLRSTDGINWEEVSEVYTTHGNAEPEMEFLPNGDIIAVLRCSSLGVPGYEFGNPTSNTIIVTASYPYERWSSAHSFITRLDGATLFPLNERIFAVGRNHLGPRRDMGNALTTKRTGFYEVKTDRLIHLFDLPSNGDTAYTGVVVKVDYIYISYFTSPIHKDYTWIMAMVFKPATEVRIARISASGLLEYVEGLAE